MSFPLVGNLSSKKDCGQAAMTKIGRYFKVKTFIKTVLFLGIIAFALYIGWGWGRIEAWSEGYNHAVDEVKMELKSAIKDGVPFWFGDIKFIPRNNGTANAVITKAEDEA